jgi:hypothetical protein
MKFKLKKGTTSKFINVFLQDSSVTTGAALTGLTSASPGLTAYYYREGAAAAIAIPLVTMTAGTWTSGGFIQVDATNMPGYYQVGIPDAALLTGASSVVVMLKGATNMAPCLAEIQLVTENYDDAVASLVASYDATIASLTEQIPTSTPPLSSNVGEDTDDILGVWGETVGIYRNMITYGSDGAAQSESWVLQYSVLADIQPFGGDMKMTPVGYEKLSTHRIFFPSGTAVHAGDRIRKYGWATGDDEYVVDMILSEEGHVEVGASIVAGQA